MLIADIKPYARNARQHSDKDLEALENSIREFGLRGRIQLVSPDNPALVNGHGRVEACKRLGWEEIPDDHIEFVGDLTDEQIKAYRIVATSNEGTYSARVTKTVSQRQVTQAASRADASLKGKKFQSERAMWRAVNDAYTSEFGKIGISISFTGQKKRSSKLTTQKTGTY